MSHKKSGFATVSILKKDSAPYLQAAPALSAPPPDNQGQRRKAVGSKSAAKVQRTVPHPPRGPDCVNLLSSRMEFVADEGLFGDEEVFVVAVIGRQGSGKSTCAGLLAGSPGSFAVQGAACEAAGKHATAGVDAVLSRPRRLLVLDAQPILSGSVFADLLGSAEAAALPGADSAELVGLQATTFLLAACHCLVVMVDREADTALEGHLRAVSSLVGSLGDAVLAGCPAGRALAPKVFVLATRRLAPSAADHARGLLAAEGARVATLPALEPAVAAPDSLADLPAVAFSAIASGEATARLVSCVHGELARAKPLAAREWYRMARGVMDRIKRLAIIQEFASFAARETKGGGFLK